LRIVGLKGESDDTVQYMGLYNKTIPQQLEAYVSNYQWANFLIHPARFEAAGIVPAEAAAFGVPTVTNDVGGLATTVADRISGVVLPKHSPAEGYVRVLQEYQSDPAAYRMLCESTRKRYENELNWDVLSIKLYRICQEACGVQA
jgi:glycosyltransferase involved in cell wall biosynthesis